MIKTDLKSSSEHKLEPLKIFSSDRMLWLAISFFAGAGLFVWWIKPAQFYLSPVTILLQTVPLFAVLYGAQFITDESVAATDKIIDVIKERFTLFWSLIGVFMVSITIFVNRFVLLSFMNSGDEHSCFFLAQCLLAGKLWVPTHPLQEFFSTTHIGDIGGKWFSVYPPGWPLLWAGALKIGIGDWINPILNTAGCLILGKTVEKVYGRGAVAVAAVFLLFSPFFQLNGASYYSHNTCLLMFAIFCYAAYQWKATGTSAWGWLAGMALGYGLTTRYLTMAALAFPVIIYLCTGTEKKWNRGIFLFTLPLAGMIFINFVYNQAITGRFFDPPIHYFHPHEKLGFISDYTPVTALRYLAHRILFLIDWSPPFLIPLFVLAVVRPFENGWDGVFRFDILCLMLAYMLYYSWGGNQYGPRYYYEAFPLICFLAGSAVSRTWEQAEAVVKKKTIVFLLASLVATIPILIRHWNFYRAVSSERKAAYVLAEKETRKPALVFLRGFLGDKLVLSPEDSIRNTPFLDRDLVYAMDRGNENKKLLIYFPGRNYYLVYYDRTLNQPKLQRIDF